MADASPRHVTRHHVSPQGSDDAPGTRASPFRSPGRAALEPGDHLLFQRGHAYPDALVVPTSGRAGARITIGAYGVGAKPVLGGIHLGGDHLVLRGVAVKHAELDGITVSGSHNLLTRVEVSHCVQGIVLSGSHNRVLRCRIHHNDRLAPGTPGPNDDYGAIGIVVSGDHNEIGRCRLHHNVTASPDFGTDGSAVELYGGQHTRIHHCTAHDNRTFSELGNPRTRHTVYAANTVTSDLDHSEFLITRGSADPFGPVLHTTAVRNRVRLSGRHSIGYVAESGHGTEPLLTLRHNRIRAATAGLVDARIGGGHNAYRVTTLGTAPTLPGDQVVIRGR